MINKGVSGEGLAPRLPDRSFQCMDEKRGGFSANFIALKTEMEPGNEAIYYSGVYIITQ